jgi:magnesium transporter
LGDGRADRRLPTRGSGPGLSLDAVLTIFLHRDGATRRVTSIDRSWLDPASKTVLWVDLAEPTIPEFLILSDSFGFHPLSVEDARAELQYPKIEAYDGYLYVILHGIDFHAGDKSFATHDVDFFLGPNCLVTVHDGHSASIKALAESVERNPKLISEGPVALFHRIVDSMVDHYRPEIEKLENRIDELEDAVFEHPSTGLVREILLVKREVAGLRRVVIPQRDVVARLARRDYVDISTDMSFRFRDVHDHLVRIVDDTTIFQDRISGVLDAHLTSASNRLNEVMKVLTVMSTIFMPLTLLSGLWGMNLLLPRFPGGDAAQFWWICGIIVAVTAGMLAAFRVRRWI